MSHVDEGELTAYADGAYATGGEDAKRIEMHLAMCANCRNRLEQAAQLSMRAKEILAIATPVTVAAPSFERIESAAVRGSSRGMRLAWAATIILALGLGWFGRGALVEEHNPPASTVQRVAQAPAPEGAAEPGVAEPAPARRESAQPQRTADHPTIAANAPPSAAKTRIANEAADERQEVAAGIAKETAPAELRARPQPLASQVEVGRAAANVAIESMTAAEAERRGLQVHRVPELEVVGISLRENGEVEVEQRLPDGKTVTITTLPQSPPADMAAAKRAEAPSAVAAQRARDAAETSVLVTQAGLRLRLRGMLAEDSLRALALKVK